MWYRNLFEVSDEVEVPVKTKRYLERIVLYSKIISVVGFCICLIILLLIWEFVLFDDRNTLQINSYTLAIVSSYAILVLSVVKLFKFTKPIMTAIVLKDSEALENGLKQLRDFFVLLAILVFFFLLWFVNSQLYEVLLPLVLLRM